MIQTSFNLYVIQMTHISFELVTCLKFEFWKCNIIKIKISW